MRGRVFTSLVFGALISITFLATAAVGLGDGQYDAAQMGWVAACAMWLGLGWDK